MEIVKSNSYIPLKLKENQYLHILRPSKMEAALKRDDCTGFYAYENEVPVGFALIKKFDENKFFLWNFLVDEKYQSMGIGKKFLREIIMELKEKHSAKLLTTTYIFGNEQAKSLYEGFGFRETSICLEENIHEVNMELSI